MKDANTIAQKQIRRLSDAVPEIQAGVNAVSVSPTLLASQNLDKAAANYAKAVQSGKMANNLKAVSLDEWKRKTLAKVDRVSAGAAEAEEKIVKFHTQRNAHQSVIDREISQLPQRTLSDSIARMTHQVKRMAEFSFDKSK